MKTVSSLFLCGVLALPAFCQESTGANSKPEAVTDSPQKPMRIRVGGATAAAQLLKRVPPAYPDLARQTRISGTVRLHAVIAKDGTVQQIEVLSGHPLLVQSALDAVRQWKYKPTLLNGEPVEVDTTIDLIFALANDMASDSQTSKIEPKLHDDVKHMLDVMHDFDKSTDVGLRMFDSMRPMLQKALPDTPNRDKIIDAYAKKLVKVFQSQEFQEGSIAAYAKYFNDEEIQELTKFYETPLGKKFNNILPAFTTDVMQMTERVAGEKLPGILQELCKEYPELNGKLPACHEPDVDKKSSELLLPRESLPRTPSADRGEL